MGKHKYAKGLDFLYVPHSSILREIETFFPITWQNWIHIVRETYGKTQIFQSYRISMVREKYGKTQTFQIYGFLKYLEWSRNPYNFQNMGKMNSHNTGKVWEKTSLPKLWISQIFWVKQKSIQFPKYGKSEFP